MKHFEHLSLEEFWTRTLQEIDRLHAQTERTEEELSATERNTLLQSIARLRHDGPLADGAEDHVSRIEALLVEAVDRETLGFRGVFDGHNDPDHGAVGIVRAVPILSERSGRHAPGFADDRRDAGAALGAGRCAPPDGPAESGVKRARVIS